MRCPWCNGSGCYSNTHEAWAVEEVSCPGCEGTGSIPDPCPVCHQHGHAMSEESGPGPLCAKP